MILCWNEGQSSTIHDHADSHCFMKVSSWVLLRYIDLIGFLQVLKGGLTEIKYSWPQQDDALITDCEPKCIGNVRNDSDEGENELQELSRTTMNTNEVFYINGETIKTSHRFCPLKSYILYIFIKFSTIHRQHWLTSCGKLQQYVSY